MFPYFICLYVDKGGRRVKYIDFFIKDDISKCSDSIAYFVLLLCNKYQVYVFRD